MVKPSREINCQEYDREEASEDGGSAAVDRQRRMEENADEGVEPRGEDDGDEEKEEEEEGAEKEEGFRDTAPSTASYLVELNLLIVVLSLLAEPTEDGLDDEQRTEARISTSHVEQAAASRLRPRRREMNEFKVLGRQTPRMRFQTTIKDSRSVLSVVSKIWKVVGKLY